MLSPVHLPTRPLLETMHPERGPLHPEDAGHRARHNSCFAELSFICQGFSSPTPGLGPSDGTADMFSLPPFLCAPFRSRSHFLLLLFLAAASSCRDASSPPHPTEMEMLGGDGQQGVVGEPLPDPLRVRVVDEEGRPLAGVDVTWTASTTAGTLVPTSPQTGSDGTASAHWTLGSEVGEHQVSATVEGLFILSFRAIALTGPPATLEIASGDGQRASIGDPLLEPLRIYLGDAYGNPVPEAPVTWSVDSGSLTDEEGETGASGEASARWTLGRQTGEAEATAWVEGGPGGSTLEVRFSAMADPPTLNLTVENLYVVQSTQRWAGDVPLVKGREGLLRVFVHGTGPSWHRPEVGIRIEDESGILLVEEILPAPMGLTLGSAPMEEPLGQSYNYVLDGSLVRPGIRITAEEDPADHVPETDEDDNGFPSNEGAVAPTVTTVPPFRVTFVPIQANGEMGDVEDGNADRLLWETRDMYPLQEVDVEIREPLDLSEYDLRELEDWGRFMAYVDAAQAADGSDRYYFGVLPTVEGSALSGMALRGRPVAIGIDESSAIAAHEWGHNWGRPHAPCGDPPGPDENYPYPDGGIGVYGFSSANNNLQTPGTRSDIMSYCTPQWISDYTYEGVMEFRANEAAAVPTAAAPVVLESLIVWGRILPDSLILEPAFRARVPTALPNTAGPLRLRALDVAGAVLFDLSFDAAPLSRLPEERIFAFAVPMKNHRNVQRLVLTDGTHRTEIHGPTLPPEPNPRMERIGPGRVRVQWDTGLYPLMVVRDANTGAVVSFLRSGDAVVQVPYSDALELVPSTGVDGRSVIPLRETH